MASIEAGSRGKCPHCLTVVKFEAPAIQAQYKIVQEGSKQTVVVLTAACPDCGRLIFSIRVVKGVDSSPQMDRVIWPISSARSSAPDDVPQEMRADFDEAGLVLPISAKASAGLSRRCLQQVLTEAGKTKSDDLSKQIDEVLPSLPSHIGSNLDAVREIGNFAAHPRKSQSAGTILDVEPGEAEWNLDVLEALFDFYYVRPEQERKKREQLNAKLREAGKSEI